jgi:hypothetical protein
LSLRRRLAVPLLQQGRTAIILPPRLVPPTAGDSIRLKHGVCGNEGNIFGNETALPAVQESV